MTPKTSTAVKAANKSSHCPFILLALKLYGQARYKILAVIISNVKGKNHAEKKNEKLRDDLYHSFLRLISVTNGEFIENENFR